jgi:hypothetical protein
MTYRDDVPDGTFHARMSRTVNGVKLGFEWWGGAYIQVCRGEAFQTPHEVINVWHSSTDQPRIPRTTEAMAERIDEWIAEYGEYGADDLVHDVTHNWGR